MRCPKCSYISFEQAERCRNCGFDFSLAASEPQPLDLQMRPPADAGSALADFEIGGSARPEARRGAVGVQTPPPEELPLFDEAVLGVDDTPLLTSPAPPRAPLSVRRSTDAPRSRVVPPRTIEHEPTLDFRASSPQPQAEPRPARPTPARSEAERPSRRTPATASRTPASGRAAPLGRRALAAIVDIVLMAAIDAVVVYFTLRVADLPPAQVLDLPIAPMLGFFALLNGGYVAAFTAASGQTIGKMLTGVRVVGERTMRVGLGQAIARTAMWAACVLPVGLGVLVLLFARDGRAPHDRFAGTRVEPL